MLDGITRRGRLYPAAPWPECRPERNLMRRKCRTIQRQISKVDAANKANEVRLDQIIGIPKKGGGSVLVGRTISGLVYRFDPEAGEAGAWRLLPLVEA
ncbi:MAG TPA: hypothetical protein VJX71_02360 [Methylomirabilota bacterium]|nr:hypothetical protein [Methylomirabilota bacterium]